MQATSVRELAVELRGTAQPWRGALEDYDAVLDLVGDARLVLLGEASHGTHEFYETRAEITRRLITDKGFNAVAVEADWPDAYRVNRYVRGWVMTRMPGRRWEASSGSQPGCGATR